MDFVFWEFWCTGITEQLASYSKGGAIGLHGL
jgi:hypothetical protein